MHQPPSPAPSSPPAGSPFAALRAAFETTRALLSGPGRGRRWLQFAGLAILAGLVGAGAPCPPLGVLAPAWEVPEARQSITGSPWVLGLIGVLVLVLIAIGGFGRSFLFRFLRRILGETDGDRGQNIQWGGAHYAWSALLSGPLYLLVLSLEWQSSRQHWLALLEKAGENNYQPLVFSWAVELILLIVTWTLLTFPLMIWIYELTPSAMVLHGTSPVRAAVLVARAAWKRPGAFWGYIGARFLLQLMGNSVALIALVPCLVVASVAMVPILGLGWLGLQGLGGWGHPGGAAAGSVSVLLALAALYAVICAALVPLSLMINAFALYTVRAWTGVPAGGGDGVRG